MKANIVKSLAKILALSVIALMVSKNGYCDLVIEIERREDPRVVKAEVGTLLIQKRNMVMRFSARGEDEGEDHVIFRGDRETMYALDNEAKEYIELNPSIIRRMSGLVSQTMQGLDSKLDSLPPDQRKMAEEFMNDQWQQNRKTAEQEKEKPPDPVEIKKGAEIKKINGFNCRQFEVIKKGLKTKEFWVADYTEVPEGQMANEAFRSMGLFLDKLIDAASTAPFIDVSDSPYAYFEQIDGFPIVTRSFKDGKVEIETTVKSVKQQSVPAVNFEPPAAYRKGDAMEELKN